MSGALPSPAPVDHRLNPSTSRQCANSRLRREDVAAVFCHLDGEPLLFAQLLYGTGLRSTEGLQLRVQDVDFAHNAIVVREGKGGKD